MHKLTSLILLMGLIFAQSDNIQQLIRDVENGDTQKAREFLSAKTASSFTSADLIFLTGLLESDTDKAMDLYRRIVSDYPDDPFADDAMMKLGEYYYVSGLYVQAANWFKQVVDEHRDYKDFRRSAKLLLKSLKIAGESELVREYTQQFLKDIPDLWDEDIQLKSPSRTKRYAVKPATDATGFFLQVGAFSQAEGASTRADLLVKSGYTAFVEPGSSGNKSLTLVLVGGFTTREEAEKTKDQIKKDLNLDSFIIRK